MKRILEAGLLAATLLWGGSAFAAAAGAPMDDPLRVDFPPNANLSEAAVGEKIRLTALARLWRVDSEKPGRLGLGTTFNNKHGVRIDIEYSASGYTLRYVESYNLRYRPQSRTIHPNYNLWMKDFCQAINASLGVAAIASVPLTVVGGASVAAAAAAPTPSGPAADGMPASGSKWRYGYRDRQYDRGEQFFTVEVAAVAETRVRELMVVDGGEVSEMAIDADKFAFTTRRVSASQAVVELTPYLRDLQKRPSQPPAGYPAPGGVLWKVSAPQYVEEEVRVPAGNFKVVRVEVSGTLEAFGSSVVQATAARFTYAAWYSRELNRYVKIHHQTWTRQNIKIGDEHVQLVAYQPGK